MTAATIHDMSGPISLRDHIAVEAMKATLQKYAMSVKSNHDVRWICEGAYIIADEMLLARRKVVDSEG